MFIALLKNVAGPDVLMLGALALELAASIVDLGEGLKGFSNKGLLTVACLFVVAAGISNTGALDYYMSKALGTPKSAADAQLRLMVPIAVVSAFLNNTPVVAIMIPIVQKWSRKCKISSAQLFIPLSFSSILGGTCTLIGTSTNLVVDGMRRERYPNERALGLFELSKFGVPVLLSGLAYMLIAAPALLPGGARDGNRAGGQDMDMDDLTFAIPMRVVSGGALDGKTIRGVDLANVPGLFCTAIQSNASSEMRIPDAETILNGEDILWFAGDMNGMQTLRRIPGLVSQENQVEKLKHVRKTDRRLVQAVISQGSSLVGRCVRDTHFRTRYDAVIIAVQRSGGRIQARIGDIVLEAGDVLLLDTSTSFLLDHKSDPTFALISEIEDSAPPQFDKLLPSLGTAVVMIAVFVAGALDLFVAALLASGVMLATGCLTQEQARAAVKWDVIVTIAAAFGISAAMEQSGVAAGIASTLVSAGNGMGTGKPGILVAVYLATVVLCNIVGNNAAAALMYPIAAGAAEKQGIDNVQMSYLLMLAASASFMSPFGYQTNLMVYGPGGYVFANFLKFGAPMQVVQLIVSVSVVLLDSKWWIGWIVGFGAILTIYLTRLVVPIIRKRRDAARGGSTDSRLDPIQEVL
ncbi:DASS family transporter: sodium ion/sulfate [Ostreococcus lucimarinus CCE9901]|uniref:DASS family transporter: sodium ion/sulfate n=1 Tax=Ostreococcus lucimarinus (strain CCE9901) TaxID=436017 RepID=A4S619_OSTLU|nr:DASS family transporter: sodium ion/sulfate [Ostreococcus lucimarinus CCE9901]ABO99003.1 DASS family transporter: sodium ion/sulfate [Ostreococcus lucimarinus CCE9901]|eukprot:XP_001420710.1 DASS family transporter: sodium ion/sulfate [Ostreococcus lucimarinus CCE9901]